MSVELKRFRYGELPQDDDTSCAHNAQERGSDYGSVEGDGQPPPPQASKRAINVVYFGYYL